MVKTSYFKGFVKVGGEDMPWESVFPIGTRFSCERCGFCCYSLIELTEKDVKRFRENKLDDSIKAFKGKASKNPYLFDISYFMKNKNGPCVKLNEKKLCSIYNLRPLVCRTFPLLVVIGLEKNLVVDLALRCPFVDGDGPEISKKSIKEAIEDTVEHTSKELPVLIDARNTLAKHVRYTFSPAFIESKERLYFMDNAIDILTGPDSILNLMQRSQFWSSSVANISHEVIVKEAMGQLGGRTQTQEILERLREKMGRFSDKRFLIQKGRWRRLLYDVGPGIFNVRDKKIYLAEVSLGRNVGIGNLSFPYEKLERLEYSKDGLKKLKEYLALTIRRPSFQLCYVMAAEYALEVKNRPVVDYELEAGIISNALIFHLDVLSRLFTALNDKNEIDGEQVNLAVNNLHAQFSAGLLDGTLLSGIKKEIDES
ncbi:MAG: YkgJ family cysteine cluster protein [Candidatus Altiarchaeota archaeon]|nr:YkgJ family cysteine cluster protein [Candidatus Altiarchaeota archaeon]